MAKRTPTHHDRLAELREAEVGERTTARDLEAQAGTARATADSARQALVQAHIDGSDSKPAAKARTTAIAEAEDLELQLEAAGVRVQRAEQARKQYESAHGGDLIGERAPRRAAAQERLAQAAREFVEADKEWQDENNVTNTLLAAMPNASPRTDGSDPHRLTEAVRMTRKALAAGEVESPAPTWTGLHANEESEHANRLLRSTDAAA